MSMAFSRNPQYYILTVMLPAQLLCLLSLGSFLVPATDLADRLSVSLTMVLTMVALRSQAASDLPKLAHLTLLDLHLLASLAFTFATAAANVLGAKASRQTLSTWGDLDKGCACFLLVVHCGSWFALALVHWAARLHSHATMARHEAGARIRVDEEDGIGDSAARSHGKNVLRADLRRMGGSVAEAVTSWFSNTNIQRSYGSRARRSSRLTSARS
uniref:Neurotransmitter-gated ion-channel transmembrane domain-containing protein n=1 Tax=Haptolina ericina TaxID=156174 RepID=A0A7S3BPK3_9EUKA|mmetsp:Transcript_63085/g.140561  ORF Transcript_63085/g.140561 Transcript_63085/m.140561 type:complete len:215 (+) Transcript_63085:139-783(+)